jgi:uncharacterized membrane protein
MPMRRTAAALALLALCACGQGGLGAGDKSGPGGGAETNALGEEAAKAKAQEMLASLGAPAGADVQAQYQGAFEGSGVEPDWTLTLLNDYVSFSRPGLDEISGIPTPRDIRANGAMVTAGPLTIAVKAGACSLGEGEGDNAPYSATILFEGVAYSGCARPTDGSVARGGWTNGIGQFLPAIDACLKRASPRTRVTIAYVNEEGAASVRLLDTDGGRTECVVSADGASVMSVSPIADRDIFNGERDPLFTRMPDAAPGGSCATSEPVLIGGEQVGWATRKSC